MIGGLDPQRHSPASEVLVQIDHGVPIAFGVPGEPPCQIRLFPDARILEILVQGDTSSPNVIELRNVSSENVTLDGAPWHAIRAGWSRSPLEVYLFACAVTDRIQLDGEDLAIAVDAVLRGMKELLRRQDSLTRDQEVGLFGELLVLFALMKTRQLDEAVDAWLGALGEEHDFSLPEGDLEVKTTTSEERTHWISSVKQLLPTEGRRLILLSVQITLKNGPGSSSLSRLVDATLRLAGARGSDVIGGLQAVGYFLEDRDLYRASWALRSLPAEYEVTPDFPKLTPLEINRLGLGNGAISEVSYRVNLEGLQPDPFALVTGVTIPEHEDG